MIKKITFLTMCVGLLANNADAQMKLIARSISNGPDDKTLDSVTYYHSGTKGTQPGEFKGKYNIPEFKLMEDSSFHYVLDNGNMVLDGKTVSTYLGNDLEEKITYKLNNGNWENDERVEVEYRAGKPDTISYQSWSQFGGNSSWRDNSRNIYTWSGNNYATRIYQTRSFGGGGGGPTWRNRYRYTATYNSGGGQTSFITAKWDNGQWEDSAKIETAYSGANISQIDRYKWDGNAWILNDRDFYTYDGNSRLEQIESEYDAGGNFVKSDIYLYYYTGSSQVPDSIIWKNNTFQTGYINQTKSIITALSNGNWVVERVESNDGNDNWVYVSLDSTTRWYWGWNVGVENIATSENSLEIYPSPASDMITIKLDKIKGEEMSFTIMDINGRIVKQWNDNNTKSATVSVKDMAAGNYILKVMENGNVHTKQFVVSK